MTSSHAISELCRLRDDERRGCATHDNHARQESLIASLCPHPIESNRPLECKEAK